MSKPPSKIAHADNAPYIPVDFIIGATSINGVIQINVGAQDLRRAEDGSPETVIVSSGHIRMVTSVAKELMAAIRQVVENIERKEKENDQASQITRQ
jgi:hypothetical protein